MTPGLELSSMKDEKQQERNRRWYADPANKEAAKARNRKWYAANKARVRAGQRRYRAANAEKIRQAGRLKKGLPEPAYPCPDACECCGRPAWLETQALALDHDHETGAFRGWICMACNLGLGKLGDNVAGLEKALAYLKRKVSSSG